MRRLKLDSRKDLTAVMSKQYQKARKKDKGKILDDFDTVQKSVSKKI